MGVDIGGKGGSINGGTFCFYDIVGYLSAS